MEFRDHEIFHNFAKISRISLRKSCSLLQVWQRLRITTMQLYNKISYFHFPMNSFKEANFETVINKVLFISLSFVKLRGYG